MAVIKCKECGNDCSSEAKRCPHCGIKVRKRVGLITWLLGAVVIVVIVSANQALRDAEDAAAAREANKTPEQRAAEKLAKENESKRLAVAISGLKTVKKALRNPLSVQWDYVLINDDSKILCISYRAQNGFGGMSHETILFLNGNPRSDAKAWNANCANERTTFYDVKRQALRLVED